MLEKEIKQSNKNMGDDLEVKDLVSKVVMILQSSLGLEFKAVDVEVGFIAISQPTKVQMLTSAETEELLNTIADRD